MTFTIQEVSNQDGEITSFYEIQWGNTIWRYTSADRDITISQIIAGEPTNVLYTSVTCWDDGMRQDDSDNNDITIHLPSNVPLADLFASTPPANRIRVTVRRRHHNDVDHEVFIYWKGYLSNVAVDTGNAGLTIICNTLLASFGRQGLRLMWSRSCPYVLYDSDCRVDPEDYRVDGEITALTGNGLSFSGGEDNPVDWFTGGYIEWTANADGTLDRRSIKSNPASGQLVLLGTTYRLAVGTAIKVFPGCNLTPDNCKNKFDNMVNYGGFQQMSGKNPFDGQPISG